MPTNIENKNFAENYDAFGNIKTPIPANETPQSNPGIVYQPANTPTNPGALKVARQTSENITFLTKDKLASRIIVGTYDISPATTDGMAAIVMHNGSLTDINSSDPTIFIGAGDPVTVQINNVPWADTPIPPFAVHQTENPNNHTEIADFTTDAVRNTHFSPLLFFSGPLVDQFATLYISDGTTPNFSGDQGDICLNGPNGQPFYCQGGTTWTGM
jgi:hypothetical protein